MTRYRRGGKPDQNQQDIIAALRQAGAQVMVISGQGFGAPDLLVGLPSGRVVLVEVKNPAGRNRVSAGQRAFLASWPGETAVVRTVEEALALVGCHRV